VLLAAFALFCYIALEMSMNTWIKPLMKAIYQSSAESSGQAFNSDLASNNAHLVSTAFGISMMVGRFLTSTRKNLTKLGSTLISIVALISVISLVLMIFTKTPALAIVAVIVTGLAFAPIFPTIVGVTFAKFDERQYGSIFGIIFAVGLLGGTIVNRIIARLGTETTIQKGLPLAVVMAGILFVISLFLGRVGAAKRE
jgi:fucose permease